MDWMAAFVWNGWQLCRGISGSFGLEYAMRVFSRLYRWFFDNLQVNVSRQLSWPLWRQL